MKNNVLLLPVQAASNSARNYEIDQGAAEDDT
jgi:hypothetical protein